MSAHRQFSRVLSTMLAIGVSLAVGLIAASPARAGQDTYIADLEKAGIRVPGGDIELLEWGYEACKLLEMGRDYDTAKTQAIYNSGSGPRYDLTVEQSDTIMHYAMTDLCDDRT